MWIPVGKILAGVVFWIISLATPTEGKPYENISIDPMFLVCCFFDHLQDYVCHPKTFALPLKKP